MSNGDWLSEELRQHAETIASSREGVEAGPDPSEDIPTILHNLRVHQIELEMQNEELRRTQAELEETKAAYVDLYDFAPVGYCTISESGLVERANLTLGEQLGVTRSSLTGQPFSRFIASADQDVYYLHRKLWMDDGSAQRFELRLKRQDSEPFWARLEMSKARETAGRPEWQVVISDITADKQRDAAVASSRATVETIFRHTPVMLCLVDNDRNIVRANPAFAQYSRASEAELVGTPVGEALHCVHSLTDPNDCDSEAAYTSGRVEASTGKARRTSFTPQEIECEVRAPGNSATRKVTFWKSESVISSEGEGQTLICLYDVTERKEAEAEEKRLRSQLMQAQKMESIGRLAGGIAHDFNNMLTVINGYSEIAIRQMGPANPQYRNVNEILNAGKRSALLVKQLLAFSRRQVLHPERFSVNDAVRGMEGMLRRLIHEHIAIEMNLAEGLPQVLADRNQIEQVVMNLAVNAQDAMPGGGTLTIATRVCDLEGSPVICDEPVVPGPYVELTVRDTGTGIDAETLGHIFEPFFTTKGLGRGTGLGLSTVQGIAIQSGGHVAVETEMGKGSSFRLYLPVSTAPVETVTAPKATIALGRGERILLVEDQPAVRQMVGIILRAYGYRVLEAAGPDEALQLFAENPVELLVTDVGMPKMNGAELAKRLQAARPGLRILFLSGYSTEARVHDWKAVPGCGFLQKPFSQDTLAATVRQLLDALPLH